MSVLSDVEAALVKAKAELDTLFHHTQSAVDAAVAAGKAQVAADVRAAVADAEKQIAADKPEILAALKVEAEALKVAVEAALASHGL